jgi:hypothetical protein
MRHSDQATSSVTSKPTRMQSRPRLPVVQVASLFRGQVRREKRAGRHATLGFAMVIHKGDNVVAKWQVLQAQRETTTKSVSSSSIVNTLRRAPPTKWLELTIECPFRACSRRTRDMLKLKARLR